MTVAFSNCDRRFRGHLSPKSLLFRPSLLLSMRQYPGSHIIEFLDNFYQIEHFDVELHTYRFRHIYRGHNNEGRYGLEK